MAETLMQFRQRTGFIHHSLPQEGFSVGGGAAAKVARDGTFLPYFGDTVIFDLDDGTRAWLAQAQEMLYAFCGADVLSERLAPQSFHITLHDLISGGAQDRAGVFADAARREAQTRALLEGFTREYPHTIRVRAAAMMNMVSTSAVMVFEPAQEEDCAALTAMYDALQAVVPLTYPLTPHVTLAYYRPGLDGAQLERLHGGLFRAFSLAAQEYAGREAALEQARLGYCCFEDMREFISDGEGIKRILAK